MLGPIAASLSEGQVALEAATVYIRIRLRIYPPVAIWIGTSDGSRFLPKKVKAPSSRWHPNAIARKRRENDRTRALFLFEIYGRLLHRSVNLMRVPIILNTSYRRRVCPRK